MPTGFYGRRRRFQNMPQCRYDTGIIPTHVRDSGAPLSVGQSSFPSTNESGFYVVNNPSVRTSDLEVRHNRYENTCGKRTSGYVTCARPRHTQRVFTKGQNERGWFVYTRGACKRRSRNVTRRIFSARARRLSKRAEPVVEGGDNYRFARHRCRPTLGTGICQSLSS